MDSDGFCVQWMIWLWLLSIGSVCMLCYVRGWQLDLFEWNEGSYFELLVRRWKDWEENAIESSEGKRKGVNRGGLIQGISPGERGAHIPGRSCLFTLAALLPSPGSQPPPLPLPFTPSPRDSSFLHPERREWSDLDKAKPILISKYGNHMIWYIVAIQWTCN